MTDAEREQETRELTERFGPGLLELMRKRRAAREAKEQQASSSSEAAAAETTPMALTSRTAPSESKAYPTGMNLC